MMTFDMLLDMAWVVHEQMYRTHGKNLTVVSEKHMAIMVFDTKGNVIFAWG